MSYPEWIENSEHYKGMGIYRWYTREGNSRTYNALDYNWARIFEFATHQADLEFSRRGISDVVEFTHRFLAMVPEAWLMFKSQMELMLGTLTGETISPDFFEAGYTRETWGNDERNVDSSGSYSNSSVSDGESSSNTEGGDSRDITGELHRVGSDTKSTETVGSGDDKSRNVLYNQGIQAYESLGEIGSINPDFATSVTDRADSNSNTSTVDETGSLSQDDNNESHETGSNSSETNIDSRVETDNDGETTGQENSVGSRYEKVKEARINYYDNLAYLVNRWDRKEQFKDFYEYFLELFDEMKVSSIKLGGGYERFERFYY